MNQPTQVTVEADPKVDCFAKASSHTTAAVAYLADLEVSGHPAEVELVVAFSGGSGAFSHCLCGCAAHDLLEAGRKRLGRAPRFLHKLAFGEGKFRAGLS